MPHQTARKNKFAAKGERDKFHEKLAVWPQKLGLQKAETFDPTGNSKHWFDLVKELYKLRGSVAHSGRLASTGHSATAYLMASNVLFDYCREQRGSAGIPICSYPAKHRPFQQIVLFKEGEISAETNTVVGSPA